MVRRAWQAAVYGVAEWGMTKRLSLAWLKVFGGTRSVPLFTPPHLESLHLFTASKTFSPDISMPGPFSALRSRLACYLLREASRNRLCKLASAQLSSSRVGIRQPVAESSLLPVLQIKFYWHTAMLITHPYMFVLQAETWVVATETFRPTDPKIFTMWSFNRKCLLTSESPIDLFYSFHSIDYFLKLLLVCLFACLFLISAIRL